MTTIGESPAPVVVSMQTNMKCQSCLAKLTPTMVGASEITDWSADMSHPEKIVTAHVVADHHKSC